MDDEREFGEGGGEDVGGIGEEPGPTPGGAAGRREPEEPPAPRETPRERDDEGPDSGEPWAKVGTGRDPES